MVNSLRIFFASAAWASLAQAWLPNDGTKTITNRDGVNIFARDVPSSGDTKSPRYLPSFSKVRGVNLGSQFIVEPWMSGAAWSSMGCSGQDSEWDCVKALGQAKANEAFKGHWSSWITEQDFDNMASYGLNTVRIPVGFWIHEELVNDGEYYPQGGLEYLLKICDWAASKGIYVIIDQHGAPGVQAVNNPFAGRKTADTQFYTKDNYNRGVEFVSWLANLTHTRNEMRTVGTIGVLNEPKNWDSKGIRDVESTLKATNPLHVQFMSSFWGSGSPEQHLPSGYSDVSFEDHRYLKWDTSVAVDHAAYISNSCTSDRSADGESPSFVTEFSLSPPDDVQSSDSWAPDKQKDFYGDWFAAQVHGSEKSTSGWTFWSWKTDLGDYRWGYKDAVAAGVIPKDLGSLSSTVCG
ncbi:uncharacterized protein JN550_013153 [Neoarthrinium moseri]|uniref:uncharacterized protein n=1 Tax=Neoarthrinium moseri TaxID=1658444 RepID=UPI001FDB6A50|nr:uncharacterized protein JN550_013153 [Neoarthrinium moseri]KAI1857584.1 hypothetical protein JN550_013153 [Neoarthrinium moseri]